MGQQLGRRWGADLGLRGAPRHTPAAAGPVVARRTEDRQLYTTPDALLRKRGSHVKVARPMLTDRAMRAAGWAVAVATMVFSCQSALAGYRIGPGDTFDISVI